MSGTLFNARTVKKEAQRPGSSPLLLSSTPPLLPRVQFLSAHSHHIPSNFRLSSPIQLKRPTALSTSPMVAVIAVVISIVLVVVMISIIAVVFYIRHRRRCRRPSYQWMRKPIEERIAPFPLVIRHSIKPLPKQHHGSLESHWTPPCFNPDSAYERQLRAIRQEKTVNSHVPPRTTTKQSRSKYTSKHSIPLQYNIHPVENLCIEHQAVTK